MALPIYSGNISPSTAWGVGLEERLRGVGGGVEGGRAGVEGGVEGSGRRDLRGVGTGLYAAWNCRAHNTVPKLGIHFLNGHTVPKCGIHFLNAA